MTGWFFLQDKQVKTADPPLLSIVLSMALQNWLFLPVRLSAFSNKEEHLQCLTWCLEIVCFVSNDFVK